MPFQCCVAGCKGNYPTGPKVQVFRFPRDQDLLDKWKTAISRDNLQVKSSTRETIGGAWAPVAPPLRTPMLLQPLIAARTCLGIRSNPLRTISVDGNRETVYLFWLWLWLAVRIPVLVFRFLCCIHSISKKRTVLITGGSSIQALHLARNFHAAGARVVVTEIEGNFSLARFSEAADAFYYLPAPTSDQPHNYTRALCEIVNQERARLFIPTCSSSSAYYDALAKPHLEALHCECFCPDLKNVLLLDDLLHVLRKCDDCGLPTPLYYPISANRQLRNLYTCGLVGSGKYSMTNVGVPGCRSRLHINLARSLHRIQLNHSVDPQHPWIVIQEPPGRHLFTCTTVDDSKVVANVVCRLSENSGHYEMIQNTQVECWLHAFFEKLQNFTGFVTFHFIISENSRTLMLVDCRVGISPLYMWHSKLHTKLILKTCKHTEKLKFIGTVVKKKQEDILFSWSDPIPYLAHLCLKVLFGTDKINQTHSNSIMQLTH